MDSAFKKLRRWNGSRFAVAMLLLSLLGPLIADILPAPPDIDPSHMKNIGPLMFPILAILIAPLFETFLSQFLPAIVCQRFSISNSFLLLIMVIPFAVQHLILAAPLPSLVNGFVGGLSLGVCYIVCMYKSHRYAFGMTALIHSLHNALVFLLFV